MTNQEQLNTVATPEVVKATPETIEKPAAQFEGVVEETLAKLSELDTDSARTTLAFLQRGETASTTLGSQPEVLSGFVSALHEKDAAEKAVVADGQKRITEIKNTDPNVFSKQYHHPDYRSAVARAIVEARNPTTFDAEADTEKTIREKNKKEQATFGRFASVLHEARYEKKSSDQILNEFHEKTDSEKNILESQEKERDIRNLMETQDLLFLHAMPLEATKDPIGTGTQMNNENIDLEKYQQMGFRETFDIIEGLSPTISVSIPSPDLNGESINLFRRQGVILGEGRILAAAKRDSGSVAFGLHKRIPKEYNDGHEHSAIRPELGDLQNLGSESRAGTYGYGYNELTVEKPKIAGLYYDMTFKQLDGNDPGVAGYSPEFSVREEKARELNMGAQKRQQRELLLMRENADKHKVPLYAIKNENGELKKYRVDFSEGKHSALYLRMISHGFTDAMMPDEDKKLEYEYVLTPVTNEQIFSSEHEISSQERVGIVKRLQEQGIFADKIGLEVGKKIKGLEKQVDGV